MSRDPVLTALQDSRLSSEKLDSLVESFSDIDAEDVTCAWSILSTINQYTEEVTSWPEINVLDEQQPANDFSAPDHSSYSFASFLSNPSFYTSSRTNPRTPPPPSSQELRPIEIDIAMFISRRAQGLLNELASWEIDVLKSKIHSLPAFHSDAATLLTMLVLRIVSTYSKLQLQLQLALSKATFAKIHFELTALLSKVSPDIGETNPLILKYRSFVTQLLSQVENAPVESIQEMLLIAQDLQRMFAVYAASYKETPETYNVNVSSTISSMPSIMQAFDSAKYESSPSSTLGLIALGQRKLQTSPSLNTAALQSNMKQQKHQPLTPLLTRPRPQAPGSINMQKWMA